MSEFYLGAYWHGRPVTLRQYADAIRAYLLLLQRIHPVFQTLEWVGDRPDSAVKISPDLGNLDDLIYRHAGGDDQLYDIANADGTPTWQSLAPEGYAMTFNTGKSAASGGVSIGISAGDGSQLVSNSVVIVFPSVVYSTFPCRKVNDYEFLKSVFVATIQFWEPETGRITSHDFSDEVASSGLPGVGWLTYLRDPRAMALRNDVAMKDFIIETVDHDGTLVSLDRRLVSPDNAEQVEKARFLRDKLIAEKLITV